jgi:hypothetical protein
MARDWRYNKQADHINEHIRQKSIKETDHHSGSMQRHENIHERRTRSATLVVTSFFAIIALVILLIIIFW